MLRKLVFAAALALGMGGGLLATESAQAAVAQPAATTLAQQGITSSQATPAYYAVRRVYRPGYRGGVYRSGRYYGGAYRGCRVVRTRVRVGYTWVWRSRRVCY